MNLTQILGSFRSSNSTDFVLKTSVKTAQKYGYKELNTSHILFGLLEERETNAVAVLKQLSINIRSVREELRGTLECYAKLHPAPSNNVTVPKMCKDVIECAIVEMSKSNYDEVQPEHLLLALLCSSWYSAAHLLNRRGITYELVTEVIKDLELSAQEPPCEEKSPSTPEKISSNFNVRRKGQKSTHVYYKLQGLTFMEALKWARLGYRIRRHPWMNTHYCYFPKHSGHKDSHLKGLYEQNGRQFICGDADYFSENWEVCQDFMPKMPYVDAMKKATEGCFVRRLIWEPSARLELQALDKNLVVYSWYNPVLADYDGVPYSPTIEDIRAEDWVEEVHFDED